MALIYQHYFFRGVMSAVDGRAFSINNPSSLTMDNSQSCHWCELGFFRKSALHGISCPLRSLAVKPAKRKRQEDLAEIAEIAISMVLSKPKRHCKSVGTFGPAVQQDPYQFW